MSEPIFLFAAIYATSLVLIGFLMTMREFSRLNRPERLELSKAEHGDRLRTDGTFGYVPGYTAA